MTEHTSFFDWLGLSGVIAMLGGAMGYGKLRQSLEDHAKDIAELKVLASKAGENHTLLARIDERTHSLTASIHEIKEKLK